MAALNLTLKKKWFDMILSGEKKHEYRELKQYWKNRLIIPGTHPPICRFGFDTVIFRDGYSKDARIMEVELNGILISFGKKEWGGDEKNLQFVLALGSIRNNINCELYTKHLHKHGVMQAEGSDSAEGAAVASEGQGEANMSAGTACNCVLYETLNRKICGKYTGQECCA